MRFDTKKQKLQNILCLNVEIFKPAVDVSCLVVTKLDGTVKSGILAAIADTMPAPVHYIGVGEGIDVLNEFNADDFARNLLGVKQYFSDFISLIP